MIDRFALRLIALAALAYAVGFALLGAMAGSGSTDPWHQYGMAFAGAWVVIAVVWAFLLYRERSGAA